MSGLSGFEWCVGIVSGVNVLSVLFWLVAQATGARRVPHAIEREREVPQADEEHSAESRMAEDIERWREQNVSTALSEKGAWG